jgi:hypothetical protein
MSKSSSKEFDSRAMQDYWASLFFFQSDPPHSCPRPEPRRQLNYLFVKKRRARIGVVVLVTVRIIFTKESHD